MRGRKVAKLSVFAFGAIAVSWSVTGTRTAMAAATVADLKSVYGPELEAVGDLQRIDLVKG